MMPTDLSVKANAGEVHNQGTTRNRYLRCNKCINQGPHLLYMTLYVVLGHCFLISSTAGFSDPQRSPDPGHLFVVPHQKNQDEIGTITMRNMEKYGRDVADVKRAYSTKSKRTNEGLRWAIIWTMGLLSESIIESKTEFGDMILCIVDRFTTPIILSPVNITFFYQFTFNFISFANSHHHISSYSAYLTLSFSIAYPIISAIVPS